MVFIDEEVSLCRAADDLNILVSRDLNERVKAKLSIQLDNCNSP